MSSLAVVDDAADAHPPPPSSFSPAAVTFSPLPMPVPIRPGSPKDAVDRTSPLTSLFPSMLNPPTTPFTPESLHALLSSFNSSLPLSFPPLVPLPTPIPLQFLPPGTVLVPLCSLPLPPPSPHVRQTSLPHPKLLTFSSSSIVHMDVPSSLPQPEGPMDVTVTPPISPGSDVSSTTSASDSDEDRRVESGKAGQGGKRGRPSPYSETESDDSSDCHSSDGSDSHMGGEIKKRRCVVSAQKLPTDTSHLDLTMSVIYFQHHSIRIIHTHDRHSNTHSTYVHGADVGGVIERKSNISRMFGQFDSPREKVLMNVTGKHNHTVGQEANVLTVEGVRRLMGLKKCQPNAEYQQWLKEVLVPRLQEGKGQVEGSTRVGAGMVEGGGWVEVEGKDGKDVKVGSKVEANGDKSPLDLMASVCV